MGRAHSRGLLGDPRVRAELEEVDEDKFRKEVGEGHLFEESDIRRFDNELHTALNRLTCGAACQYLQACR